MSWNASYWFRHRESWHPDLNELILQRLRIAAAIFAFLCLYIEWLSLPKAIRTPDGAHTWVTLAAIAAATLLIMALNRRRISPRMAQPAGVCFTFAVQFVLVGNAGTEALELHGGHGLDPMWGLLAAGWLVLSGPWLLATLTSGLLLCLTASLQSWDGGLGGAQMVTGVAATLMALRVRRDTLDVRASLRASRQHDLTGRAELERAQHLAQRRIDELEQVYRTAPVGLAVVDAHMRLMRLNQKLAALAANPQAQQGDPLRTAIPIVAETLETACQEVLRSGSSLIDLEFHTGERDERRFWQASCYPLRLEDREGVSVVLQDTTESKRSQQEILASKERYELAAKGASDGLWDWDLQRQEIYFSARWKAMLGYSDHEIGDQPKEWASRVHEADLSLLRERVRDHLEGAAPHFEIEHRMRHRDGSYRWMLSRGVVVRDENGEPYRMAGSQTDVSDRKRYEERLVHDAAHDALTGLPNRLLLGDRLDRALTRCEKEPGYRFAILFVDLDRFKLINDSLGHAAGDKLLIQIGDRLREGVRAGDTVARIGGDEFTILLEGLEDEREAFKVAERIQEVLAQPVLLGVHEVRTTGSIGIALSEGARRSADELLRDADLAMYRAKGLGGGNYAVFQEELFRKALDTLNLETALHLALERNEFELWYQPILSLDGDRLLGCEALMRWRHPEQGLVSPAGFIPLAEETGFICEMGAWALHEACRQAAIWRDEGLDDLIMSVNVSARQLRDERLADAVAAALAEAGLEPHRLELELTESSLIENLDVGVSSLHALAELGVRTALDDFGTGYSSLSYLNRFPLNTLKISEQFVQDAPHDANVGSIARIMIELAHSLGLRVVAEGVETEAQRAFLADRRCEAYQGYLRARPQPAEEIGKWMLEWRRTTVAERASVA